MDNPKKFKAKIGFHREKEDNWDLEKKAKKLGFSNSEAIVYLGYELEMEIEVSEDNKHRVLKIDGVDVSDKEIYV